MKTIIEYLDEMKEKNGSDYKTAQILKISKEAVSQIRKRKTIGDETALKIADELGIERSEVLLAAAIAKSEGEIKNAWLDLSRKKGIAACLIAGLLTIGNVQKINSLDNYDFSSISIMRSWLYVVIGVIFVLLLILSLWSRKNDSKEKQLLSC